MEWVTEGVRALSDLPFPLLLAVAGLLAFAESGLGLGSVVPGETGVLILGAASADPARYPAMLLVVALGVTAGDHVGYVLGRRHGDRMRETRAVRRLGVRHWDRATGALRRYGAAAVFVTRLVPVVRTLTPAAAGVANVPYRRFLPASLVGSLIWSAVFVSLGAFAGASAERLQQLLGWAAWAVFGLVAVSLLAGLALRRRRARRRLVDSVNESVAVEVILAEESAVGSADDPVDGAEAEDDGSAEEDSVGHFSVPCPWGARPAGLGGPVPLSASRHSPASRTPPGARSRGTGVTGGFPPWPTVASKQP